MWFPTVTLALWLVHLPEAAHSVAFHAFSSLIVWYLPFYIYAALFSQTAVESAFCVCCKVATWCNALTSSLSRQLRSMRCRKQSSACWCSTSFDMAWPPHRSPFYTMGFLLECRVCMDSVCSLCLKICLNYSAECSPESLRCAAETLNLRCLNNCCNVWVCAYIHPKTDASLLFKEYLLIYQQRELVGAHACQHQWKTTSCFLPLCEICTSLTLVFFRSIYP